MVTSLDSQSILLQWRQKIRVSLVKKSWYETRYVAKMSMLFALAWRHTSTDTTPPWTGTSSNNSGQEEWNGECASSFVDSLCCVPHHPWRRNMTNTICSYPCFSQEQEVSPKMGQTRNIAARHEKGFACTTVSCTRSRRIAELLGHMTWKKK